MQKIVAIGWSEFEYEQLVEQNAQQIYVYCPNGINIREVCLWPECVFRSLLQFLLKLRLSNRSGGKPPPSQIMQAQKNMCIEVPLPL